MNTSSAPKQPEAPKSEAPKTPEKKNEVKKPVAQDVTRNPALLDPTLKPEEKAIEARRQQHDPYLNPEQKKFARLQEEEAIAQMNMSESEANAIIDKREAEIADAMLAGYESVDRQEWGRNDPRIPDELLRSGQVKIVTFECPEGHKTKATNRQVEKGIECTVCRDEGNKGVQAHAMSQFVSDKERKAHDEKVKTYEESYKSKAKAGVK